MNRKLIVERYGKIEHAELSVTPLTLLVGDNNSGKSYLLSLLWGIQSLRANSVLFEGVSDLDEPDFLQIREDLQNAVEKATGGIPEEYTVKASRLLPALNILLKKNKDSFVSSIFNYKKITIGKLYLEIDSDFEIKIQISNPEGSKVQFKYEQLRIWNEYKDVSSTVRKDWMVVRELRDIFCYIVSGRMMMDEAIYLPAARTGFILAKDVINKVGRQQTFDAISGSEEIRGEIQPFTKPIIRFLDALDSISVDNANESYYKELAEWIEHYLAKGSISYAETGMREIRYVPDGMEEGIPLRASSAVVTELAPLLLILKYGKGYRNICYEEPEMCLHPGLQLKMARLLIRLMNRHINVIATTHSDIILQHVNNMCKLSHLKLPEQLELLEQFDMDQEDCLKIEDVTVYQLTDCGETTKVKKLQPTQDGFEVSTFSNALMSILNQSLAVEEYEVESED